jgi:hypothetical protein
MYLSVTAVKPLDDYKLELQFENNEVRIFDLTSYLERGAFQKLKTPACFNAVKVAFDTVEWPGEIDLDPEILYADSLAVV